MSSCVLFDGYKDSVSGYGFVWHGGVRIGAHRAAWIKKRGAIPNGLHVLHTCDVPACIQNDEEGVYILDGVEHPRQGHLWLGTQQDNMKDRRLKGRDSNATLTESQVLDIRRIYKLGSVTQTDLARQYGVFVGTINKIVRGDTWTHVHEKTAAQEQTNAA